MMEWINENSGLLSLVAAIAAVAGIFVPFIIRWLDKKEKRQELLDEYEIRKDMEKFPMSYEERGFYTQREILRNKLKKIKK